MVEDRKIRVPGFRASGIACGIKGGRRKDLALIVGDGVSYVAGVFTRNRVKAAPVLVTMERIRGGRARGVVVNSGNANACTGKQGLRDAQSMTGFVERGLGCRKGEILVCSTGVIGEPLPVGKIKGAVGRLVDGLSPSGWYDTARAIMTTDAFPKIDFRRETIGGKDITLLGIAKGAGMISPSMATMLAFFVTDACIKPRLLRKALRRAVDESFNRITVDGDTSTNDTVLIFSNSNGKEIKEGGPSFEHFCSLLKHSALRLARMIVEDGEGATRFVEVRIEGASSRADAEGMARGIANSVLVKTALFGGDPNWGRIMAVIGRSAEGIDPSRVDIYFDNVQVVKGGCGAGNERKAERVMKKRDITITVDCNMGRYSFFLWTTDLGYEYVRINSEYRT